MIDDTFILVVNDRGVRTLVNVKHVTHVKETVSPGGIPGVIAKITAEENYSYLASGQDAPEYFDWLMNELNTLSFWDHTHEEDNTAEDK